MVFDRERKRAEAAELERINNGLYRFDRSLIEASEYVVTTREQLGPYLREEDDEPDDILIDRVLREEQITLEDWTIYIGEWARVNEYESELRVREGYGIRIWPDGSIYEGWFKQEKANGKGRLIHADGYTYEGTWENDMARGTGTYTHYDGC